MFYQPELFVYLMLLPVVCLIVLPALFSTIRVAIGAVLKNRLKQKDYNILEQEQESGQEALA